MSTLRASIEKVVEVNAHPNADRLELISILGWQVVAGKGVHTPGGLVLYIPVDAVLPPELDAFLFPIDSKVKLTHGRVKSIKLRGAVSQGMIVDLAGLNEYLSKINSPFNGKYREGQDMTEYLGIKKYEAPVRQASGTNTGPHRSRNPHPQFHKYTDIENIKNYPKLFDPDEEVIVTEKIHGSNFRAGWVPFVPQTFGQKVKKFFGLTPKYQFVYGSHNVQLDIKALELETPPNIYAEAVHSYDLMNTLKPGEVVYGEIYGGNVQKNFAYDAATGERKLVVFDVMVDGKYLSYRQLMSFVNPRHLDYVPILYAGPFNSLTFMKSKTLGASMLGTHPFKEGVVIKPLTETKTHMGRKILKLISDEYALSKHGGNSDEEAEFNH